MYGREERTNITVAGTTKCDRNRNVTGGEGGGGVENNQHTLVVRSLSFNSIALT